MYLFRKFFDKLRGMGLKKIVSFFGTLFMLVALVFLWQNLNRYGMDFSLLGSPLILGGLVFVAVVEGIGIVLASVNYHAIIKNVSGIKANRVFSMLAYTVANLYKYIPGGIMYVVGRNRIAVETDGLSHSKVAFATVVEGVSIILGAVLIAAVFSFESLYIFTRNLDIADEVAITAAALVVFVVASAYCFRQKLEPIARRFLSTVELLKPMIVIKRMGFALILMFVWGLSFAATMFLLGQPMTVSLTFALVGLYLLAWLVGFMTPGAPSGLGIREAIMLMFISGMVYESILLSAIVVHRVIAVAGDLFAYVICLGLTKLRRA